MKLPGTKSLVVALLLAINCFATEIQVYCSPSGGGTEAVTAALSKATTTVLVQAYSFTRPPISERLGKLIKCLPPGGQRHKSPANNPDGKAILRKPRRGNKALFCQFNGEQPCRKKLRN
jgi:hypothetical protein